MNYPELNKKNLISLAKEIYVEPKYNISIQAYQFSHGEFEFHCCHKEDNDFEKFIVQSLRSYTFFDYEQYEELIEDINDLNPEKIDLEKAKLKYEFILNQLMNFESPEGVHPSLPPNYLELNLVSSAYLLSDAWNYTSLILINENKFVNFVWHTSE